MALIQVGNFHDLSVSARPAAAEEAPGLEQVDSFGVLSQVTREAPADSFEFYRSPEARGLALQGLRLEKGFQGLIKRVFNATSDVYFLAWCWDFSGQQPLFYPGAEAAAGSALIPIKGGELREFVGSGVVLFPARNVTAGLALRLQLWESKRGTRDFGQTMSSVAQTIQRSQLNALLSVIAVAAGVTTATIDLTFKASLELASVIGKILQATSDDYVDYYEGYFPARGAWSPQRQSWRGHMSEITLERLT